MCIFILRKFGLVEDFKNHRVFQLNYLDTKESMRIDASAIRALHLLPDREQKTYIDKEKDISLLGLLDTCKTKMGSRVLKRWLLSPLLDRNKIEHRLDIVEFITMNIQFGKYIGSSFLQSISDLEKLAARFFKTNQNY